VCTSDSGRGADRPGLLSMLADSAILVECVVVVAVVVLVKGSYKRSGEKSLRFPLSLIGSTWRTRGPGALASRARDLKADSQAPGLSTAAAERQAVKEAAKHHDALWHVPEPPALGLPSRGVRTSSVPRHLANACSACWCGQAEPAGAGMPRGAAPRVVGSGILAGPMRRHVNRLNPQTSNDKDAAQCLAELLSHPGLESRGFAIIKNHYCHPSGPYLAFPPGWS
jgi:hypothetical protein